MKFLYSLANMWGEMAPYLLLGFLVAGVLYAFVPGGFYRRHLASPGPWAVIKAALIGVPLPLCSCGVLPTAVSLRRNGASRGAATSFLIATPQTGIDSIAATWSLLGLPFAIIRPAAALLTAFIGGMLVSRSEKGRGNAVAQADAEVDTIDAPVSGGFAARLRAALRYGLLDMVQNIGKWLIIGLLVAAAITVAVPDGFFTHFARYPLLSMLAVVVVAVPMYVCSTGSIPIALSLMLKGLSPGAAFVLLMAGPAANFASILIVGKSLGRKSAVIYLSTIVAGAISIGLAIDYLMPRQWFPLPLTAASAAHCHLHIGLFQAICSALLLILLLNALIRRYLPALRQYVSPAAQPASAVLPGSCCHSAHPAISGEATDDIAHSTATQTSERSIKTDNNMTQSTQIKIQGMTCAHCKAMVEKNIAKLPGVTSVTADLSTGLTTIQGVPDPAALRALIDDLGFTLA